MLNISSRIRRDTHGLTTKCVMLAYDSHVGRGIAYRFAVGQVNCAFRPCKLYHRINGLLIFEGTS